MLRFPLLFRRGTQGVVAAELTRVRAVSGTFAWEWHVANDAEHQRVPITSESELLSQLTILEGLALTDFPFMVDLVAGMDERSASDWAAR